jgi:hypothetical protein
MCGGLVLVLVLRPSSSVLRGISRTRTKDEDEDETRTEFSDTFCEGAQGQRGKVPDLADTEGPVTESHCAEAIPRVESHSK